MNAEEKKPASGVWDWPNQQVVREDSSGPGIDTGVAAADAEADEPLDEMTKTELLDYANEVGATADNSMTKAEIRTAIDEAAAEGK